MHARSIDAAGGPGRLAAAGLVLGLTGCGADSPGGAASQSGGADAVPADPIVRVKVSGAVDSKLETRGSMYCGPAEFGASGFSFELYATAPPETLNLVFSRDLEPGEYPIVGADDPAAFNDADASFSYRGPDRRSFDRVTEGTLMVKEMPAAPGEAFLGAINATMVDRDGSGITLNADINVIAGSQTFAECP